MVFPRPEARMSCVRRSRRSSDIGALALAVIRATVSADGALSSMALDRCDEMRTCAGGAPDALGRQDGALDGADTYGSCSGHRW